MPPRLLCAAFLALLIFACGGGASEPTPSPAVSPVPDNVAIDLDLADRLYIEGDAAGAVLIYSAAALRGSPEQKQQGLWALARIQYEVGDNSRASQNARAFLALDPDSDDDERRAYLLLGYSEMAQGRTKKAKDALEKYIRLGGAATPYAQLPLAEIAARDEDFEEAARGVEAALAAELPLPAETEALFALARYQEEADNVPAAIATLQRLAAGAATEDAAAESLWEQARLYDESGDTAGAQATYTSLIVDYPAHERALEALPLSEETSLQSRALVLFRHRENDSARQAYDQLAADPYDEIWGEAHYRLGVLAERAGDSQQSLAEYSFVIDNDGGSWIAQAYWDRATVLESLGRLDEAIADFSAAWEVSGGYPPYQGLFRAGLIRYKQGRYSDAASLWESESEAFPGFEGLGKTNYWLGRAYTDMGDSQQAFAHFHEAEPDPLAYYGLRAIAMLSAEQPRPDLDALAPPAPDWKAVESWLATFAGPEPGSAEPSYFESPEWLRAEELLEAGLVEQTIDEIGTLIESLEQLAASTSFPHPGLGSFDPSASPSPTPATEDPLWALYWIARRMTDEGYPRRAALAAEAMSRGGLSSVPPALLTLVYPTKHLDAVNEAARAEGISPLLLLALIRQESWFDASAVSPAGALGLAQVIPATGEDIAADLGLTDFRESDLLDPETSLRFGAHYLAQQIEGFGGNIAAALAAYNGGPGNAGRWAGTAGADPDLLLETIDFEETRLYVRLVLENYALYRYAYGISDELSLPLD